jgi:hypothetical protein
MTTTSFWEDDVQVLEAEVETIAFILQTAEGMEREEARRRSSLHAPIFLCHEMQAHCRVP